MHREDTQPNSAMMSSIIRRPVPVSSYSSLDTSTASTGSLTHRLDLDTFSIQHVETHDNETIEVANSNQKVHSQGNNTANHIHQMTKVAVSPEPLISHVPTQFSTNTHYLPTENAMPIRLTDTSQMAVPCKQNKTPSRKTLNLSSSSLNNNVPEFLYQLTKLLTDNNRQAIEWANGKIEVHNPPKLASEILHNYFRHSKYASFQRQLNYFGFRKLAGKGKMSPCSYVNDEITPDIRSLLRIKRKTTGSKDRKNDIQSHSAIGGIITDTSNTNSPVVNPVLAGILNQSRSRGLKRSLKNGDCETNPHFKVAVGKGIRHKLNGYLKAPLSACSPPLSPSGSLGDISGPTILKPDDLAKTAVGRGIKHQFAPGRISPTQKGANIADAKHNIEDNSPFTFLDPHQLGMDVKNSLTELKSNFRNSFAGVGISCTPKASVLNSLQSQPTSTQQPFSSTNHETISRVSSLVDLAMIPSIEAEESRKVPLNTQTMIDFLDFPEEDMLSDENMYNNKITR